MKKYITLIILIATILFVAGCEETTSEKQEQTRTQILERADSAVPTPVINNFLTRKAVARWMERNDVPTKVWHVYVLGDNGNVVQYFTSSTRPINFATYLTPPDRVGGYSSSQVVRKAPSADGVYYDGGSGDCWFFFDTPTDRLVNVIGSNLIYADAPFDLDIQPIKFQASE